MRPRAYIVPTFLIYVLGGLTASAAPRERILMHTYQDGPSVVFLSFVDLPSGTVALLRRTGPRPQELARPISRQQFENTWTRLMSSGAPKYSGGKNPSRTFDAEKNYVFSIGYMPDGAKQNFVVPKNRASGALRKLAQELQAFAKGR